MARAEAKLVGYCMRCGGDSYDDGKKFYHRCPPKWPSAPQLVNLKYATDKAMNELNRRAWAKTISAEHFDDLKAAVEALQDVLRAVVQQEQA